jgi:hypothetical protein
MGAWDRRGSTNSREQPKMACLFKKSLSSPNLPLKLDTFNRDNGVDRMYIIICLQIRNLMGRECQVAIF